MRSFVLLCVVSLGAGAQGPPGTDIWLVPLDERASALSLGAPRNVTARRGYDNQPSWSPRGDVVYFTSNSDGAQTDVWSINVANGQASQVTRTAPESEYSATAIEGGRAISVVRVERDSTQRLWRFPLDGGEPSVLLENVRPVGYHAWADSGTLALFVLGSPATLQIADVRTGSARIAARGIGRGLARIPGLGAIAFIEKASDSEWWVMSYDVATGATARIAPTLERVEDFAWTPGGRLLMARESRIYAWNQGTRAWDVIGDLASGGVQGITRMSVSPDGRTIAIVARDDASS